MNLYLVKWEEFDGNEHTTLMASNNLSDHLARFRIYQKMKVIDRHFDESDIVDVEVVEITEVDNYLIKLEAI